MNTIHNFMHRLHSSDAASLFIRVAVGVAFLHAGWLKVTNIDQVLVGFGAMGIPTFLAYAVSYIELIGGAFILLGLFVRYFSIALAVIMFVAFAKAHVMNGFGLASNGYEYVFVLFFASLALVTLGSGKYSLARLLKKQN